MRFTACAHGLIKLPNVNTRPMPSVAGYSAIPKVWPYLREALHAVFYFSSNLMPVHPLLNNRNTAWVALTQRLNQAWQHRDLCYLGWQRTAARIVPNTVGVQKFISRNFVQRQAYQRQNLINLCPTYSQPLQPSQSYFFWHYAYADHRYPILNKGAEKSVLPVSITLDLGYFFPTTRFDISARQLQQSPKLAAPASALLPSFYTTGGTAASWQSWRTIRRRSSIAGFIKIPQLETLSSALRRRYTPGGVSALLSTNLLSSYPSNAAYPAVRLSRGMAKTPYLGRTELSLHSLASLTLRTAHFYPTPLAHIRRPLQKLLPAGASTSALPVWHGIAHNFCKWRSRNLPAAKGFRAAYSSQPNSLARLIRPGCLTSVRPSFGHSSHKHYSGGTLDIFNSAVPPYRSGKTFARPVAQLLAQVRYKPGQSIHWRRYRTNYAIFFQLTYLRQHGLTKYLSALRGVTGFSYLRMLELSIGNLVGRSHLLSFRNTLQALELVQGGFWLLNGCSVTNPFIQLYQGDWLQCLSTGVGERNRLNYAWHWRWRNFVKPNLSSTKKGFLSTLDSPSYLEVDELTQTFTLLFEPLHAAQMNPAFLQAGAFLTMRLYNWKYLT